MAPQTETFIISGMSCGHCVRAVREALERIEGVEVEAVEIGAARVRYDADATPRARIAEAVEEEGYAVEA